MDDEMETSGKAGLALGGVLALGAVAYVFVRVCDGRRKPVDYSPEPDEEHGHGVEGDKVASSTKSDNECGDDSVAATVPPRAPSEKKHFLDEAETWKRARHVFPRLLNPKSTYTNQKVESVVFEYLSHELTELRKDEENFQRLLKLENAVDFCLALGLNETVVRKRYEAIGNLQRELNIVSKTPTLVSIRHLVYRLDIDNPYGEVADINGSIRESYRGKDWLSYLGVNVEKSDPKAALLSVKNELERSNYTGCYVHGTTATSLVKIVKAEGKVVRSKIDENENGARHDFGEGVYCFEGKFKSALSFAVDRCWPLYSDDTGSFVTQHNPAVILFQKPRQFSRQQKLKWIYHVGDKPPFPEKYLKEDVLGKEEFLKYDQARKAWKKGNSKNSKNHQYWKEFVKLARFYCHVPDGKRVVYGWLHDCESTGATDRDLSTEPKIDEEKWVQHCFRNPMDLGKDRLFIELNVNWEDWTEKKELVKALEKER
jgi:hypothetical protein